MRRCMVPLHVFTMSLSFFLYNNYVVTSMPLSKYTTEIDPDHTTVEIAQMLSKARASAILTKYVPENNYLIAILFRMLSQGRPLAFACRVIGNQS